MAHVTRKRQVHDVQSRKEMLKWYLEDNNRSLRDTANHFSLPYNTVKPFHKNKAEILPTDDDQKKKRKAEFSALENYAIKFGNSIR